MDRSPSVRPLSWLAPLALAAGCATLPPYVQRTPSYALPAPVDGELTRLLRPLSGLHPGETGFLPLSDGREALACRIALADLASSSIDVQTFLWPGDRVGAALWQHLTRAADRGVRVRILVDDNGRHDGNLLALAHPNIEVRFFNPWAARRLGRVLELLRRFDVLDHRMHNKLFIVDDAALLVGGRNVAAEYFGLSDGYNFRDLELLVVGAVLGEASAAFDDYWNSRWAYPASSLAPRPSAAAGAIGGQAAVEAGVRGEEARAAVARFQRLRDGMMWGRGDLLWDLPDDKITAADGEARSPPLHAMRELMAGARRGIVIEAAYFAPDPELSGLREARLRGVSVALLTNSLATTNHVSVHAAYAPLRPSLLRYGVDLYELRPDAAMRSRFVTEPSPRARLGLHTKVAVFDGETVATGSFNLDPRSASLNTEVILVARCPALARAVLSLLAPDFGPANAWRLGVGPRGGVVWHLAEGTHDRVTGFEPAGLVRKVELLLLSLLPLRDQT